MGYKYSFMDNATYTAQDINERFSCFLTEGVALSDTGNLLDNLNGMTKNITSQGVAYDSCKVVCQDGVYKISKGSCFMQDGSAIIFDNEGFVLEVAPYVHQYVYLVRNEPENKIDVVVSTEAVPEDGVLLAEITEWGEIYDRRKVAMLKVNSNQSGTMKIFYDEFYSSENYASKVVDTGSPNMSYIVIWYGYMGTGDRRVEADTYGRCIRAIDDSETEEFIMIDSRGFTKFKFNVKKNGDKLEVSINPANSFEDYAICYGVI